MVSSWLQKVPLVSFAIATSEVFYGGTNIGTVTNRDQVCNC